MFIEHRLLTIKIRYPMNIFDEGEALMVFIWV